MQAVKAYYEDGKFIPYEPIAIPKGSPAIVAILDFAIVDAPAEDALNDVSQRQIEAMRRFIKDNDDSDEPIPEFERVKFREALI
jgi:predicted DNA-binding antitoxin AbrB/MazE fold protein